MMPGYLDRGTKRRGKRVGENERNMGRVEIGTGKEIRQEDALGTRNKEIRRKDGQRKKERRKSRKC
jgi:hypothetical protein